MDVDVPETDTSSKTKLSIAVSKPISYEFDLGNLLITDPNPLPTDAAVTENVLNATARDSAQALINQLLIACPITSNADGVMLNLPSAVTALPREKPLPVEKSMTKWEKFAKKKGIKPKTRNSRSEKVFNEATGEWVPKWGYKDRNGKDGSDWLVEVDENDIPINDAAAGKRTQSKRMRKTDRKGR